MALNENQPFQTVYGGDGQYMYLQGGVYYAADKTTIASADAVHGTSKEPVYGVTDPVTGGIRKLLVGGASEYLYSHKDWPMILPHVLGSPPSLTNGVANAATAISGSILHSVLDNSKMLVLGGPVSRGVNYPSYMGANIGIYPQITSSTPVAVEFNLDTADSTGRFEISIKGNGSPYRVLLKQSDGSWGACTEDAGRTLPNDGNLYLDLVTLGSAGRYTVRIETAACLFLGIRTAATDAVSSVPKRKRRYIVVGDSFTEPTFSETGSYFQGHGWVQTLALLTGFDLWSAGSGGTGYSQSNGGRPKFSARLAADVLAYKPDGVIFAGGINDGSNAIDVFDADVAACFAACSGVELIALSSFWPGDATTAPSNFWQMRDVVKTRCVAAGGKFLDLMDLGIPDFLSSDAGWTSSLSTAYTSGTNLVITDIPAYFKTATPGLDHWFLKIGSGAIQAVREVSNISGSGPYTLSIGRAIVTPFAAETPVSLCGFSYQTGTGKQGATVGDGTSDRYTGNDGTHPTKAGHQNIAYCTAERWARSMINY